MKSLAHKDWPYAGTAHEWRGFVKDESKPFPVTDNSYVWSDETRSYVYQKQNFGPELP